MIDLKKRYCVLLLLFLTLGVYYPVLFAPFNSVDDLRMVEAYLNSDGFSLKGVFLPGGSGYYYRPLIGVTFSLDRYLWGLEASFMHLENVLLHAVNVVTVFFLALKLYRRAGCVGSGLPLLAAGIFAVHPITTEAVNWVSGRTDPLAALFLLPALLLLFIALDGDSLVLCAASVALMLIGCLAKETAIFFFPAACFLIFSHSDGSVLQRIAARFRFYLLFAVGTSGYFLLRHVAFSGGDGGIGTVAKGLSAPQTHHFAAFVALVKVAGFYLKKLLVPWPLNFGITHVSDFYLIPGIFLILSVFYLLARKRDDVGVLLLTSIALGSSSLLVALTGMAWTPIAERYLYLPSATFAVAAVFTVARFAAVSRLRTPVLFFTPLCFTAFGYGTFARTVTWQSNVSLFADTVRKSPDFAPARNDLALALQKEGKKEEARHLIESNIVSEAVNNHQLAGLSQVALLCGDGKFDEARQKLNKLLESPGKQELEILRKLLKVNEIRAQRHSDPEARKQILEEMIAALERVQRMTGDPFCFYRIGQLDLQLQRKGQARESFARAFQEAPPGAYYRLPAQKLALRLRSAHDD